MPLVLTSLQALEEGLSCQQICDKYHAIHKVHLAAAQFQQSL
jgi:methionyl-tRNA synthetase